TTLYPCFSTPPPPPLPSPLSLHDALPICRRRAAVATCARHPRGQRGRRRPRPSHHAATVVMDRRMARAVCRSGREAESGRRDPRSEEHTSELQSLRHLVCRLLLEKKKKQQ